MPVLAVVVHLAQAGGSAAGRLAAVGHGAGTVWHVELLVVRPRPRRVAARAGSLISGGVRAPSSWALIGAVVYPPSLYYTCDIPDPCTCCGPHRRAQVPTVQPGSTTCHSASSSRDQGRRRASCSEPSASGARCHSRQAWSCQASGLSSYPLRAGRARWRRWCHRRRPWRRGPRPGFHRR